MKKFIFLLLFLSSFDTFAVIKLYNRGGSCLQSPNLILQALDSNPSFATKVKAKAFVLSLDWASTTCSYKGFLAVQDSYDYTVIRYTRESVSIGWRGSEGCNFDECKEIASQECSANGATFDESSYVFRSSGDYDASCNLPPPEQPVKTSEECQNLSNNSCNVRGGVSDFLFTDNNDFTYECAFTCGDGSTGDENGSHADGSDGICNQNDPNDLIDCDIPIDDPECVGCGAFTPDDTTDISYNPDGSTGTDGTGTDGITSTQGDVLINEVKKLKNENAEQTIKAANAITTAVTNIDNDDKLQGIIDAVNDSGGGSGDSYNDTGLRADVNGLSSTVSSLINAQTANDNINTGKITDALSSLTEGNGTFVNTEPETGVVGFYTSIYPLGVAGMFAGKVEEFQETEFYAFLDQFKPTFSGNAPDMSFCMNFGTHMNLGCFDLVLDPRIWPALKIFILITAGFTCRKILFGG